MSAVPFRSCALFVVILRYKKSTSLATDASFFLWRLAYLLRRAGRRQHLHRQRAPVQEGMVMLQR